MELRDRFSPWGGHTLSALAAPVAPPPVAALFVVRAGPGPFERAPCSDAFSLHPLSPQAEERSVDTTSTFSSLLDDEDEFEEGDEWEEEAGSEVDETLMVR